MLGTFRKHSTWLWGIIIAATAVSLVWWTGNRSSGHEGATGEANYGTLGGKKITTEEINNAAREVRLQYFLSRREWPDASAQKQIEMEAYKRLFLIKKQEQLGIHVADTEVARIAALNLGPSREPGVSSMDLFEKQILIPGGLTVVDYERFLRHSLGEQQLMSVLGVSGELVTARDARAIYERENQEYSAQVVFFDAANYLATVSATPAALSEYYSNQVARYRLPERRQVSYVEFKATNYWAAAGADMTRMTNQLTIAEVVQKYGLHPNLANLPNLAALVDSEYKRKTNFYTGVPEEKAKETIKGEIQHTFALMAARKLANAFADPLLSAESVKATALAEHAATNGLTVKVSAPFDINEGPAELDKSENFAKLAFRLSDEAPISEPIVGTDAVFIIAKNKTIPSENPPFETVKARVESDFKRSQATDLARSNGAKFAQSATNGLAQGKAFATLAADAKAKAILLPNFALSSTNALTEVEEHMSRSQFLQVALSMPVGEVSPFIPTMDGGMVLYIKEKQPLDEKKAATELPAFLTQLRQTRQREAFEQWFNHEAPQALADTPVVRRQPEINQPGAAN